MNKKQIFERLSGNTRLLVKVTFINEAMQGGKGVKHFYTMVNGIGHNWVTNSRVPHTRHSNNRTIQITDTLLFVVPMFAL